MLALEVVHIGKSRTSKYQKTAVPIMESTLQSDATFDFDLTMFCACVIFLAWLQKKVIVSQLKNIKSF